MAVWKFSKPPFMVRPNVLLELPNRTNPPDYAGGLSDFGTEFTTSSKRFISKALSAKISL